MKDKETGRFVSDDSAPWKDEDKLRELYQCQSLSAADIGDELDCSASTIRRWLRKHDIELRSPGPSESGGTSELTKERLHKLYTEKQLGKHRIAEKFDCHHSTVRYWLEKYDIEIRTPTQVTSHKAVDDPERLRELYHGDGLTTYEIADIADCHQRVVWARMQKYGIESRELVGENHHWWKPGTSDEYYGPEWRDRRKKARERDNHRCQRCGMKSQEHKSEHGTELHVHHIQPYKTFDSDSKAHKLDNLITLCFSCHRKLEGLPIDAE